LIITGNPLPHSFYDRIIKEAIETKKTGKPDQGLPLPIKIYFSLAKKRFSGNFTTYQI